MTDADKTKLLFGPYKPPALKVGDQAICLYRDADVVIVGWSDAPISWPRCYIAGMRGSGPGLLIDEELVRAIRHESALAIQYWWGVSGRTATHWRQAFGVGRKDTEGSRRLIHQAAEGGLNARSNHTPVKVKLWTAEELALVGTLPDVEVATRLGRGTRAVYMMRKTMKLPVVRARRGPYKKRAKTILQPE